MILLNQRDLKLLSSFSWAILEKGFKHRWKKVTEIVRDAGAEWKNLDKDEKDRYEKMTEEPTRVYKAEMEEYKRKNSL